MKTTKGLINQLELGYSPMTAYEFTLNKKDKLIEKALEFSSLYILAKRPVITFENITFDYIQYRLNFEIHQKNNSKTLKGSLSLIQEEVSKKDDTIAVAFNFLDNNIIQKTEPFNNVHGFSLVEVNGDNQKFLLWFSPEKLLQNWWKGYVECEIIGDYKSFLNYDVLYVGKATRQSILKRLTGHETLQDILSLETPVTEHQLPANEVVILPFEFQDNLQIHSFGDDSDVDTMVSAFMGEFYPSQEKVFLDAEKALINSMLPKYNSELFNNYPISKDGLYKDNYDSITYKFVDPITLRYENGEICGDDSYLGGDFIVVENNEKVSLYKS